MRVRMNVLERVFFSVRSALLANWTARHRNLHPEDVALVVHFCGASSNSTDYRCIVARICAEVVRASAYLSLCTRLSLRLCSSFVCLFFRFFYFRLHRGLLLQYDLLDQPIPLPPGVSAAGTPIAGGSGDGGAPRNQQLDFAGWIERALKAAKRHRAIIVIDGYGMSSRTTCFLLYITDRLMCMRRLSPAGSISSTKKPARKAQRTCCGCRTACRSACA